MAKFLKLQILKLVCLPFALDNNNYGLPILMGANTSYSRAFAYLRG